MWCSPSDLNKHHCLTKPSRNKIVKIKLPDTFETRTKNPIDMNYQEMSSSSLTQPEKLERKEI